MPYTPLARISLTKTFFSRFSCSYYSKKYKTIFQNNILRDLSRLKNQKILGNRLNTNDVSKILGKSGNTVTEIQKLFLQSSKS